MSDPLHASTPSVSNETSRAVPAICSRCEALPAKATGSGRLFLWFPLGHTLSKVVPFLASQGVTHEVSHAEGCVILSFGEGDRERVLHGLASRLGPEELQDTKALFMEGELDRAPGLSDFARVGSLKAFAAASEANWLIDLLEAGRFTSYFQPIFDARDTTQVFAHEALFRGLDEAGSVIPPGRLFGVGKEAGMMFQLDLQARLSAIRSAAREQLSGSLFINFNPAAIYDPAFCLRSTMRAIDNTGFEHGQVVFEVVESERIQSAEHLAKILAHYRTMGFKVALDDLGSGYSSLNLLAQLKPDFVKLDMELIRGVDQDPYKAVLTRRMLELANELGARTIAEGVETAGELAWLQAHGATYVQGFLLGRPAPKPLTTSLRFPTGV